MASCLLASAFLATPHNLCRSIHPFTHSLMHTYIDLIILLLFFGISTARVFSSPLLSTVKSARLKEERVSFVGQKVGFDIYRLDHSAFYGLFEHIAGRDIDMSRLGLKQSCKVGSPHLEKKRGTREENKEEEGEEERQQQ